MSLPAIEITPDIQNDIDVCKGFVASGAGKAEPDMSNIDGVKEAANRILEHYFGPLGADGTPSQTVDREIFNAISKNAESVRTSISANIAAGKTGDADFYEILYNVLADSGVVSSVTLPMTPETAQTLLSLDYAAAAGCGICGACGGCGTCSACTACGSCIGSVVVTSVITAGTLGALGIGGAVAWFFD